MLSREDLMLQPVSPCCHRRPCVTWLVPMSTVCVCVCQGKMLECGMLERDRQTLKRRSASLLKHLMVDEMLLMLLQAEDILTGNMAESIMVGRFIYCPVPSTSTSASVPCLLDSVTVSITGWSNIWLARWFDGRQQEFRNCVIKYKT